MLRKRLLRAILANLLFLGALQILSGEEVEMTHDFWEERCFISENNKTKFSAIKAFNLPIDQYAITGSGALGIRNLRAIGDIDIIVNSDLWDALENKYGVTEKNNVRKIVFPGAIVEALGENSFFTLTKDVDALSIADRIADAEIIEGLPFESLEHVLYYKRKMGREKDKHDIKIIEALIKGRTQWMPE